jgi:hypothetical protein
MLNPNELNHEYFEELCSLAVIGRVTTGEFELLKTHLQTCLSCRSCLADFNEIVHEHLPLLDAGEEVYSESGNVTFHDASYKHRFVQRVAEEGIVFSGESERKAGDLKGRHWHHLPSYSWPWKTALTAAAALLLFGVPFFMMRSRIQELQKEKDISQQEISRLKAGMTSGGDSNQSRSGHTSVEVGQIQQVQEKRIPSLHGDDGSKVSTLQQELHKTQSDYEAAVVRSKSLEEQLQKALGEVNSLRSETISVKNSTNANDKLKETEAALQQAVGELDRLRREKNQTTSLIASQQNQLRELNDKLTQQTEKFETERELFTTSREIRNLMGSRNLHIIDVTDVDSRGTQRPFGRVFYTEGKSLLFYAYDLDRKKKSLEKFSFQAWGQLGAKSGPVQSLGLFQADDQAQNRWVLRCDDPTLLAQIDSVFVTIEPTGGSSRPQGQQLIYAFLKANPNHP